MDDPGARLPEADPVLLRSRRQEVVDLLVLVDGAHQVLLRAALGPDQVIAVDRERSEEHTSELQSRLHLVCRLLLEKKKKTRYVAAGGNPNVRVAHRRRRRAAV